MFGLERRDLKGNEAGSNENEILNNLPVESGSRVAEVLASARGVTRKRLFALVAASLALSSVDGNKASAMETQGQPDTPAYEQVDGGTEAYDPQYVRGMLDTVYHATFDEWPPVSENMNKDEQYVRGQLDVLEMMFPTDDPEDRSEFRAQVIEAKHAAVEFMHAGKILLGELPSPEDDSVELQAVLDSEDAARAEIERSYSEALEKILALRAEVEDLPDAKKYWDQITEVSRRLGEIRAEYIDDLNARKQ